MDITNKCPVELKQPGSSATVWSQHNRFHVVGKIVVCQQILHKSTLRLTEGVEEEVSSVAVRGAAIAICSVIKLRFYSSSIKR